MRGYTDVMLSVRPTVTFRYLGNRPIGWITSRVITQIGVISLGPSLLGATKLAI